MSTVTQLGPSGGNVTFLSTTGNIEAAMFMVINYLNSTYSLQAADTVLEQKITTQEAQLVQAFQQGLISGPNNYITQIENLTPANDPNGSDNYGTDMQKLIQEYTNANAQNQSLVKVMDGNNSTAQNTLSQNSQGQQGDIQTLSSINGVSANLSRLIQG